ncbi:MAG: proteasome-activating nucleotidase [Methanobacteriota archaeon]|nr:MAG: proteasome-activating nucleotidase [Euryarchaeota archaeon]
MPADADAVAPSDDDGLPKRDADSLSDRVLAELERDYKDLREQAQQLLTDRMHLENEVNAQKDKIRRLDEDIRTLRTPPHVIGNVQDIIDDEHIVVRSSNGTVFLVSVNRRIDKDSLKPGTRVALNQDTLAVVEVLQDAWDPLVMGAELIERPTTTYADMGGVEEQIMMIKESIELPLKDPDAFRHFGIDPPSGVLLVGPPGCGKTMLAKAVASSTECTFIRLVASELAQKYIGEGGRMVRELFDLARERSPAILFIDEIDAIGAKRLDTATSGDREVQRTLMQLLAELDGFEALGDVKLIAATNRPDILDEALLRPGRFDRIIEIPMPNEEARKAIIKIHLKGMPKTRDVSIKGLVEKTGGFSGAELKAMCVEAGMRAIRAGHDRASKEDFTKALKDVKNKRDTGAAGEAPPDLWT